jgi:hypothetical protein
LSAPTYLTACELADLIGCEKNSYACMRRWLQRNKWPYVDSLSGFPKVSRAYHDARMSGSPAAAPADAFDEEPNFGALSA